MDAVIGGENCGVAAIRAGRDQENAGLWGHYHSQEKIQSEDKHAAKTIKSAHSQTSATSRPAHI